MLYKCFMFIGATSVRAVTVVHNCTAYLLPPPGGHVFGRVGLFVSQHDYLKNNERICMKLLPEVSGKETIN